MAPIDNTQLIKDLGKGLLELYTPSSSKDSDTIIQDLGGLLFNMKLLTPEQRTKLLSLFGSGRAIGMKQDSIERHNLKKLVELVEDPNTLAMWLNLFNPPLFKSFLQAYKSPQLVQANLDTFAPSAISYLMENVGFVGLDEVVNKSSESTAVNEIFAADKLRFSKLKGNTEAHREFELFKSALMKLGSIQTEAPFYVKHRMLHMHASLEGDVA